MKLIALIRKEILQLFYVFLSFGLMVFVSYLFVSRIVENLLLANATETLNTAEAAIRSDLREAELALHNASLMVERMLIGGESLEEIQSYLSIATDTVIAAGDLVPGFINIYAYIQNNMILGIPSSIPEDFVPERRSWYIAAASAGDSIAITSPYIDAVTGGAVISLTKNLRSPDGERLGVIAINIDISHMTNYVQSIRAPYFGSRFRAEDGHGMLFDENFIFVVHPFDDVINVPVATVSSGHARIVQDLLEQPDRISIQRTTDIHGQRKMLISKRIFNGWYLGLARPLASYYEDVRFMAVTLSLLGIVFMTFLSVILIRFSLSKAHSEEKTREKSSFLARMSHEIRTPMNSILGMAELIQRKTGSGEIREYVDIIQQSGDALINIIDDILDFSKIESGRLHIQNRNYDIASVINDLISMMRPRIAEKSIEFFVNVDSTIPAMIHGDGMRLRQVLTNLLSNAIKYTHKGFISLDMKMELIDDRNFRLICTIQDSGIGIKLEDQKSLFTEFNRVDSVTNQDIEGTGLGLVISRALCRAMGGDVILTSEYGKGSTFCASVVHVFVDETPAAQVLDPDNKRVLFYDERPKLVESLRNILTDLKVDFKNSADFREFVYDLQHGQHNYAFVSSKHAMDCILMAGVMDSPIQLVIMVEPGEVSIYGEVTNIMMPVYSITMANALNDFTDALLLKNKKFSVRFTAPSAKILIVDDISTNLMVAKELMSPYDMKVYTCMSGLEAIELLKKNRYDIVFMDHMMPVMDGVEATTHIRNLPDKDGYYRKKLPIIALTANVISSQREMFLQYGINDFLAKPIDIQKLDDILVKWIPGEKRIKAEASPEKLLKQQEPASLHIQGIDVEIGLRNCGGNAAVFSSILADFCSDAQTRLVQIADALAQNDAKLYTTLVHALKGAAWSVGAVEIGEEAFWLENTSATGDLSTVADKTVELEESVKILLGNIRAAIEQDEGGDTGKRVDISALKLGDLKTALEEMNIEAVNSLLLTYVELPLDPKTKEMISALEQHILMFEYEKAIEIIDELF